MQGEPCTLGVVPGRPRWISPVVPWQACTDQRKQVLQRVWARGQILHHLTPSQQEAYHKFRAWDADPRRIGRYYAFDISRRWGKSLLCCLIAVMAALMNSRWRIVYCAPMYNMVGKILRPLMAQLLQDCPPALRPEWVKSEGTYHWHTGSRIELIGLDVNPDGARGTGVDLVILDEAGFFDNLEYLLLSVISPQMMGRPHARIVAASTPPISPSHYWSQTYVPDAVKAGAHDLKTIEQADQYEWDEIEEHIRLAKGRKSVTCRREFFCEHVTDESMAIIPEFRDVASEIVRAPERVPTWRDCYVAMDPGWKDMTAVLFGYWDFERQILVVEDEIAAPRLNSADVAASIVSKETVLWEKSKRRSHDGKLKPQPYLRVSDNDPRLLYDLATQHHLVFIATQKDEFTQQVNGLRIAIQQRKIQIHPRCKILVHHLKNGVWKNEARKVFAWEGGSLGHFDAIAALIYLWRNVQQRRNPAPKEERYVISTQHENRSGHFEPRKRFSQWSRTRHRYYIK